MTVTEDFTVDAVTPATRADFTGDDWTGGGGAPVTHDYEPIVLDANATDAHALILGLAPFSYYKMDDAAGVPQDSSGNGRHATSVTATIGYHQAALTTKTAFSIALTAGGRVLIPQPSNNMQGPATAFTLVSLMMFTSDDEGLTAQDDVFLSQQTAGTAEQWGVHRQASGLFVLVNNGGAAGVTPDSTRGPAPPLNEPFVLAIQATGQSQAVLVNGLLMGTSQRLVDDTNSTTLSLGRPVGTFYDMPGLRLGPTALWQSALTYAQILDVTEALADQALLAAAYTP